MKKHKGHMHAGLTKMAPAADSGVRPPSGKVNQEATRGSKAPHPKSLGPRTA